ncbi:SAM-dependent methyltransferase [Micromonospora peucetia]|uniref:N-6 DNA methylase n=1 Tax=Micromonospora peucetia TaxID=47871 RepID=UPI00224FD2B5|nr:N-6 DNA methylase [Micromonospora peucetia]MCX4388826.1 SAM-dependent methyltransferase [Micromonospora peucetia]
MPQPTQVTAAEISRLAGVTRATVSNWRRRHPDFPAPSGGTETSPAYDLNAVRSWLSARGQLPASSPADDLRTALRTSATDLAHRSRLLPLVVAASRIADTEVEKAIGLPDDQLSTWAQKTSRSYAVDIPGTGSLTHQPEEAELLRAVLRCVDEEGAAQTLEVLAEGDVSEGRAGGAYRTPPPVTDLMAEFLAGPGEPYPDRVFDPACGVGGLLLAAAGRGARELHGQDVVGVFAAQAAARLAVQADGTKAHVQVGDSMRDDAFPTLVADAVLCTPPYGHREWGHEDLAYDPRWMFGLPPKGESELAWLQHCLAHLTPGGRAVLLMPPGAAFRPSGRRIRAEMVRSGALRAVVALPVGMAQPLHIGLQLWLLERPHPQATLPSTVLLVDTAGAEATGTDDTPGRRSTLDWPAVRSAALDAWHAFDRHPDNYDPVPGVTRAVPVVDLLDEAVDLSPARHVRAAPVPARPDELAETAYELRSRLRRAATGLVALSGGHTWPPAGADPRPWRTASVADLLRGAALTLLRAPAAIRSSSPAGPGSELPRTLTARDVVSRRPASGAAEEERSDEDVTIRAGDVILPEMLHEGVSPARVADASDAGHLLGRHLHLLRPDPGRLDPWFLAGFLAAEDNLSAASSGTTVVRTDPRRLRLPLLPLVEQQRYGRAFRQLHALRVAADIANRLADETARTLAAGLTGGALLPPEGPR